MTMKNGFLTAILVGSLAVPASAATFTAENLSQGNLARREVL